VPPILVAHLGLSNFGRCYFDSLNDISKALICSSLRAFQFRRLLAP
jgi:hypothetical protein